MPVIAIALYIFGCRATAAGQTRLNSALGQHHRDGDPHWARRNFPDSNH